MSFGLYRPTFGVAAGHRELSSNQSLQDGRRYAERACREEVNPITGQPAVSSAPARRSPPDNLSTGLMPSTGPMDHMGLPDKDVPGKKVDPTRNQSAGIGAGVACVPLHAEFPLPPKPSESAIADVLSMREPTQERRSAPGQVVRGNFRPKDNISGGCVVADKPATDPLGLLRKPGVGSAGDGSGGPSHLVPGPCGLVPACAQDAYSDEEGVEQTRGSVPYRPVWETGF